MRNQRRLSLRPANRLRVLDPATGESLGVVADVSATGLRLLTTEPIEAGVCLNLCLELQLVPGRVRLLELEVACRWSRRNFSARRYEQGVELLAPSAEFARFVATLSGTRAAARGEPV